MHHEQGPEIKMGLKGLDLINLGIPDRDQYMKKYCRRVEKKPIDTIFYIVFSFFRNVAILEGVLARGRAGNASSSLAEEKGALAPQIATLAWKLVKDNNLEQALRNLKKKMQREGLYKEMKLRKHFEKPCLKRAREKEENIRRSRKTARRNNS